MPTPIDTLRTSCRRVSCRAFAMPSLLKPPIPPAGCRQRWHQLYGSARSLAIAEAVESDTRPYLVIARDARELDQLRAELEFFLGEIGRASCRERGEVSVVG